MDTLTESSKDLADELLLLEKDLTERERKESDYTARIQHLQAELQDVKAKYTAALRDHANTLSHMQVELESVRKSEQSFRTRVRDMELDNDDLEKAERCVIVLCRFSSGFLCLSLIFSARLELYQALL